MLTYQGIADSQAAQGDIFLDQITEDCLPPLERRELRSMEGPPIENYLIVALGEVTGHKHKINVQYKQARIHKAANADRYFGIVEKETDLTHDEHDAIGVCAGIYEIVRQREATIDGKERRVAD